MLIKFKEFLKFLLFEILNFAILFNLKRKDNTNALLLIRLDAIGDYILFRNFIKVVKYHPKYRNCKITLVGNSSWRDFAEKYDRKYIDEFIWINRQKFVKDYLYRYNILKYITSVKYRIVIHPVYSREFFYGDAIVRLVSAREKIGSVGDLTNIKKWQKRISDKYYSKLIDASDKVLFEFDRNREFFENLFGDRIYIVGPYLEKIGNETEKVKIIKEHNYIVLFPGASSYRRRWARKYFAIVADYLYDKYSYISVVCGSSMDSEYYREIYIYSFRKKVLDFTGRTKLYELITLIRNAKVLVSNDTSGFHIGAAVGVPTVCVSNGYHLGRFHPYTQEHFRNVKVVYPPIIMNNLGKDYSFLCDKYGKGDMEDINSIKPETVIKEIDKLLKDE